MRTRGGRTTRGVRAFAVGILVVAIASTAPAANAAWVTSTSASVTTTVATITGMIQVSPLAASAEFAPAAGSSVNVPFTVHNTSATSTWTAMRVGVTTDRALDFVKITYSESCRAHANNGTSLSALPFQGDDTLMRLEPGETRLLCWVLTHQRPAGEVGAEVFTVNVALSGRVRSWSTGEVTVPMTFTISGDARHRSAPSADDSGALGIAQEITMQEPAEHADDEDPTLLDLLGDDILQPAPEPEVTDASN